MLSPGNFMSITGSPNDSILALDGASFVMVNNTVLVELGKLPLYITSVVPLRIFCSDTFSNIVVILELVNFA